MAVKAASRGADTPFVIEGGTAGGSALQLAAQRRSTADRLMAEATWFETVAADEQRMAGHLEELPPAYSILHDLKLPGAKGNVDHLVVGPGGAFLVVTRRCTAAINVRDGQLWAGDAPLRGDLEAARMEAQLLTQTLATPVVPVVGFLDAVMPAATPPAIDGVLVCSADTVARVISRGSHTLLSPPKVAEIAERATPLLHTARSVTRTASARGVAADPMADDSISPVVPPPPGPSADSQRRRRATEVAAAARGWYRNRGAAAGQPAAADRPAADPDGPADAATANGARPSRELTGRQRSVRFALTVITGLCVLAVALGSLARMILDQWPSLSEAAGPGVVVTTTVDPSSTLPDGTPLTGGLADRIDPPPVVLFLPVCPTPGAGWQLVPGWPGDVPGVVAYDLQVQLPDGDWTTVGSLTPTDTSTGALLGQAPGAQSITRAVAVMSDGSRRAGLSSQVAAPADAC